MRRIACLDILLLVFIDLYPQNIKVGTYYFDGWSGETPYKNSAFFRKHNTPTHVTDKLYFDYAEREPIWGWRDDDLSIMHKQIELAADNRIDFFMFCWYYHGNNGHIDTIAIKNDPLNTSLELFIKARNKHRLKFSVLIANHEGYEINSEEEWIETIEYLSNHYFSDRQYLKIDNKPVTDFFTSAVAHKYIDRLREVVKKEGYTDLCYFSNGKFYADCDINGWYNIREKEIGKSIERSYDQLVKYVESCWWKSKDWNVVPVVMSGWDKRPWELEEKTIYYTGRSPKSFGKHLEHAILNVHKCNPPIKIVMIYAWNELGEGGYIIPTKGDPHGAYIKQIKKVRNKLHL